MGTFKKVCASSLAAETNSLVMNYSPRNGLPTLELQVVAMVFVEGKQPRGFIWLLKRRQGALSDNTSRHSILNINSVKT